MPSIISVHPCLTGGGETGATFRAKDWSSSHLGAVDTWPHSLCTVVGLVLNSKFPMFVAWGPELVLLYNDAYAEILGDKHPTAAGALFSDVWSEIWASLEPIVARALAGAPTVDDSAKFTIRRNQTSQDACYVFSYSPLLGDDNEVSGIFCVCSETIDQVQASRNRTEENDRLQAAQSELKASNVRKDEFLSMLAHELRNPLAPIAAAAELLKQASLNPLILQKATAVITRQVQHMKMLVDDLLDVSRMTRGLVTLKNEILELNLVLQEAIEQVQPNIRTKNQHLCLGVPKSPCVVTGDRTRLIQIFSNLLNNASKFTQVDGNVYLTVIIQPEIIKIEIRDCGVGISADVLPYIFEPFTQGERSIERSQGGLGLGLSLVKSLVELHGGNVTAHSDGIGEGSTFVVQLLRTKTASVQITENMVPKIENANSLPLTLSLLVVDDNKDAADMMGMLLEANGYRVSIAYSSSDALAKASLLSPAVLFLDLGLPNIDGYMLARRLREMPETKNAFLVAISGYGQPQDVQRAMDAGFNTHMIKPVDFSLVLAAVEQAILRG